MSDTMPFEGSGPPPSCQFASTVCNGNAVYECVLGHTGELIEPCTEACSGGRCVSQACASVEGTDALRTDALRGCRFYAAQIDNIDSDDGKATMLVLTNASSSSPACAVVETRSPGGGWDQLTSDCVPKQGTKRFVVRRPVRDPGRILEAAFRITTDNPVLAMQFISDDADRMSTSSSGTVLLPAQALGNDHRAITFSELPTEAVTSTPGSRDGAGVITIVGTVDGTTVQVTPTAPAIGLGLTEVAAMSLNEVMLDEGDVLQVFSTGPDADLSGSTIASDRPVAVFSGNVFTTYGHDLTGFNDGDMAIEQMPPTVTWGKEYVGARLAPQDSCDQFFGPGGGSWQIVALNDTVVTLSPSAGTGFTFGVSTTFDMKTQHLKAGESLHFSTYPDPNLPPGATMPTGDFVAKAPDAFLLAQWLDCAPGLSLGVDTRFVANNLQFALPANFDHQAVVTRRAGIPVLLDGEPIPGNMFSYASANNKDYEVARLTDAELGSCPDSSVTDMCQHILSGAPMGFSLRGMDIDCSYSLTIPPNANCVLPAPGCEH